MRGCHHYWVVSLHLAWHDERWQHCESSGLDTLGSPLYLAFFSEQAHVEELKVIPLLLLSHHGKDLVLNTGRQMLNTVFCVKPRARYSKQYVGTEGYFHIYLLKLVHELVCDVQKLMLEKERSITGL